MFNLVSRIHIKKGIGVIFKQKKSTSTFVFKPYIFDGRLHFTKPENRRLRKIIKNQIPKFLLKWPKYIHMKCTEVFWGPKHGFKNLKFWRMATWNIRLWKIIKNKNSNFLLKWPKYIHIKCVEVFWDTKKVFDILRFWG